MVWNIFVFLWGVALLEDRKVHLLLSNHERAVMKSLSNCNISYGFVDVYYAEKNEFSSLHYHIVHYHIV